MIREYLNAEVAGIPLSRILEDHVYDMPFEDVSRTDEKTRFWQRFYTERRKAYKSKDWCSKLTLRRHLYEDKSFRNSPLYPDLLVPRYSESVSSWVTVEEHTEYFKELDQLRACLLYYKKVLDKDFLAVRYLREDIYSYKDLVACIFPISKLNTSVPEDWYNWCVSQQRDLKVTYREFKSKWGLNLFDFYPPFRPDGMEYNPTDVSPAVSLYWDEYYGYFFQVPDDELHRLSSFVRRMELAMQQTGLTQVEYYEHSQIRSSKVSLEEEKKKEQIAEDLALLEAMMAPPVPVTTNILGNLEVVTDLDALLALDQGASDSEDEGEHPAPPENVPEWMLYLQQEQIDTIDLYGLGLELPE
jgi:hypothetical protein